MNTTLHIALVLATISLYWAGCEQPEATTVEVALADLPPSAGLTPGGDWQSVGFDGDPWLRYPGKTTLVLEHGLGAGHVPSTVLVYLSFYESGASASLSAGDTARILSVDDQFVTIENHSEANFYVRVVLR